MNVLKKMCTAPLKLPISFCCRALALGLLGIWSLSLTDSVNAQILINTGAINNTGLIRVENQASGLPPIVGGRFEYFGSGQSVLARRYHELLLTGSGTKTATGNFTVTDSVIIATNVTLRLGTRSVLTLNGSLREGGYLAGMIQKSVDLSGSTTSSSFGNIGASISWSGMALGLTTVLRGSDSALIGNGNQSIKRFYNIVPTTNSGLNATLVFKYSDNELNGQNPATLLLWRSVDNGATWRRQGETTVDVTARTITKVGVTTFALYTAADTAHPLGPAIIEGIATVINLTSGNNQIGTVGSALANPFVVTVTDTFGNPVPGANVMFAIASVPGGATGQSLSVTNATTGSNGQASTILTLGDRVGIYSVTASSAGLSGSPVTFVATAAPGTARRIALISGNSQIGVVGRPLTNQFVVMVSDTFGNPLQGTSVTFAIDSIPPGATGQSLSVLNATTDSAGHASTVLTLGTRVGTYVVAATSAGLTGSPIIFAATGIAALAKTIVSTSGNNQIDTISQTLPNPFIVAVIDTFGNPVQGITVTFAIDSIPPGATGQSLSVIDTTTDSTGHASTFLTLGNRPGIYTVRATSPGLVGSPVTFRATAILLTGVGDRAFKPTEFQLFQNYPNPFNPSTEIQFDVKERGHVQLTIYDIVGRVVEVLLDEVKEGPMRYRTSWSAANRASGIYFMRLIIEPQNHGTPTFVSVKRMLLIK